MDDEADVAGKNIVAAEHQEEGDRPVHGLTDRQLRAAGSLVAGMKPGEVAKELKMSREQLWRWRAQNPLFRAHVQRLRVEHHASRIDRLWSLSDKALDVIEDNLDEGDPQVALAFMRIVALKATDPLPAGPDPDAREGGEGADSMAEALPASEVSHELPEARAHEQLPILAGPIAAEKVSHRTARDSARSGEEGSPGRA